MIVGVGNPDDWWTQNCPPRDCPPVGNSEVGNPEGCPMLSIVAHCCPYCYGTVYTSSWPYLAVVNYLLIYAGPVYSVLHLVTWTSCISVHPSINTSGLSMRTLPRVDSGYYWCWHIFNQTGQLLKYVFHIIEIYKTLSYTSMQFLFMNEFIYYGLLILSCLGGLVQLKCQKSFRMKLLSTQPLSKCSSRAARAPMNVKMYVYR